MSSPLAPKAGRMGRFVAHHNANPRPLIWTASATDILVKVNQVRGYSRDPPLSRVELVMREVKLETTFGRHIQGVAP